MLNGSEIVILDVFWNSKENGGSIPEIDPTYKGENVYSWNCFSHGGTYGSTVRDLFWSFETLKSPCLNNYCTRCKLQGISPKYNFLDIIRYVPKSKEGEVQSILQELMSKDKLTTTFITTCPDCHKMHYATLNTFERRNSFCCKECASKRKAVLTYGSIESELPDVVPYYSGKNLVSASKFPMWKKNVNSSKVILICPRCGKEHTKRLDAVERNGAYCGPCAKSLNNSRGGNSLYELYPSVAEMLDGGNNKISSRDVSPYSSNEFEFLCKKGIPHTFRKSLAAMVQAYNKGNLGCTVCSGFKIIKGINDFKSKNPIIAEFWNYEKNKVRPEEVYYNSEKYYWFTCPKGHDFKRDLSHMMRSIGTSTLGCPVCHGNQVNIGVNDLKHKNPDILKYWNFKLNTIKPSEVSEYSNKYVWFNCIVCSKPYLTTVCNRVLDRVVSCEDCRKRNWSIAEKELVDIIKSWGITVKENVPILDGGQSLDLYLPDLNIAIEYNGLYWHSDKVRPNPNYHYSKYKMCENKGIRLIYVWEDDYTFKKDILLSSLKRKLGVSSESKINARDTVISLIDYNESKEFLEKYHIQGSVRGSLYVALKTKEGDIVSVCVLKREESNLILQRYATSCIVRGGFSKIISYIEGLKGFDTIITFSDNGVSDGSLYKNNGFICVGEIKPDYSYVKNGKRVHKFNYRIERFKRDPDLIYKEGLSERELSILNKLYRVYDAGKLKWIKEV